MQFDFSFFLNSVLLGIGLAMDAFSVSLANGLNSPKMPLTKMLGISGVFAFFQAIMPLGGWFAVHTAIGWFNSFSRFVPYIALILLCFIGGKMLLEGIRGGDDEHRHALSFSLLITQGIATSIDALSVGFTIAHYNFFGALISAVIISVVTFGICLVGVFIGKKFGTRFSTFASILGGVILIAIGINILLSNI